VNENTWHHSQKVQSTEEESVVMTWKMQITPDVLRWVLSWGSHAEVLEPDSLKERVKEEARGMAGS
jgi:predicted DNA-binding transcriptional regulator YafY